MNILLVAAKFPPYNTIGALRLGKLAKYLAERGHEVRVLTARNLPILSNLAVEIEAQQITRSDWLNVNFLPELVFGGRQRVAAQGYKTGSTGLKRLGYLYRTLFNIPDELIGWLPYALRAGQKLLEGWLPDLIFASMPATSLIVASILSRRHRIPWVAELRDLWVDNQKYDYPAWRRALETRLERRVLQSASGFVSVTSPRAEILAKKYSRPTITVANGFDLEDYPKPEELASPDPRRLRIVYTGTVYTPFQDAAPLFDALRILGKEAGDIQVIFYCRYPEFLLTQAARLGVAPLVAAGGLVPYRASLRAQMEADVLLYLLWNDPQEQGAILAKLYEYLGARRPILAVGRGHDQAAEIVRQRRAGLVSNDPQAIALQLLAWKAQKKQHGAIPPLPPETRQGFSRQEQFETLEQFLCNLLSGLPQPATS